MPKDIYIVTDVNVAPPRNIYWEKWLTTYYNDKLKRYYNYVGLYILLTFTI